MRWQADRAPRDLPAEISGNEIVEIAEQRFAFDGIAALGRQIVDGPCQGG